jgi:hypothetical protein
MVADDVPADVTEKRFVNVVIELPVGTNAHSPMHSRS